MTTVSTPMFLGGVDKYAVVVGKSSPYAHIYEINADGIGAELATIPAAGIPAGGIFCCDVSKDGKYLVVGFNVAPYAKSYKIDPTGFTALNDTLINSTEPPHFSGTVLSVRFNNDGDKVCLGSEASPFFTVYDFDNSGDEGIEGRIAAPTTAVSGVVTDIQFSKDGLYVFIASNTMQAYLFSAGAMTTAPSNRSRSAGGPKSLQVHPDGDTVFSFGTTAPFIEASEWTGSAWGSDYADLSSALGNMGNGTFSLAISPSGSDLLWCSSAAGSTGKIRGASWNNDSKSWVGYSTPVSVANSGTAGIAYDPSLNRAYIAGGSVTQLGGVGTHYPPFYMDTGGSDVFEDGDEGGPGVLIGDLLGNQTDISIFEVHT